MAGVPGMPDLRVDGNRVPYPDSTTDFVKVLRSLGFDPQFREPREDRRYVGHKALEVWLPILQIAQEILVSANADLLVGIIRSYFGGRIPDEGILHVDWRISTAEGHDEEFTANGPADEVVKALGIFERRTRNL